MMNLKHIRLFVTLACLLAASVSYAQNANIYNTETGLSNTQVNSISQDSRGFVWICTENGLNRFDGMEFTVFRHESARENSLASDLVLSCFEDSEGVCWVGTSTGLQIFDPVTSSFSRFNLRDPEVPESDQHISCIIETPDLGGYKEILVSTSQHGIYLINSRTHELENERRWALDKILPSYFVSHLFLDSADRLWVAFDDGGLCVVNNSNLVPLEGVWDGWDGPSAENIIVTSFFEDPSSRTVFIGSSNCGILVFDPEKGSIGRPRNAEARSCAVMSLLDNTISESQPATILVGTENSGLRVFDPADGSISALNSSRIPFQTHHWKVHNLMLDRQGNVWVGAYQAGVMVIPRSVYGFEAMTFSLLGIPGDNCACVTSIVSDPYRGGLWVGTDGGGIFHVREDGRTENFTAANSGLGNNSIMALAIDRKGTLWIATYLGGLYRYDGAFRPFSDQNSIGSIKTAALAIDRLGKYMYVGTYGAGMSVVDLSTGKLLRNVGNDDTKWITSLYIDRNGLVWAGTFNGPRCYDPKGYRITRPSGPAGEITARVYCFRETSDGKMCIGTGENLMVLDRQTPEVTSYSIGDGLPSNVINAIEESRDGNLWISTSNGLSRLDPKTGTFRNFYRFDGLQDNEFRYGASYSGTDGKLYFGGVQGLTSFYPDVVESCVREMPQLYFSRLQVMNEEVAFDASGIRLPAHRNMFTLKFGVLEYTNPLKVVYSYRIERVDPQWRQCGALSREASYSNLRPGRYTLEVKAYFDGNPDECVTESIPVIVDSPWYLSTPAIIFYLLMLALAAFAVRHYLRGRKQREKEREQSRLKELKLSMFTDLTHEIRTPLTLVLSPLKKLRENEVDPGKKNTYNLMYRNTLRVMRLVNQLLDIRKIDSGQMEYHFRQTDVVFFIKDIMNSFDEMAVSRGINFVITPSDKPVELWIDQGNFDKIIFNILSNAFKHVPDSGSISIDIGSPEANDGSLDSKIRQFVRISIENDGEHIPPQHLERIFERFFQVDNSGGSGSGVGLNLAKMLVEKHHGVIRAANTERGAAFTLLLPVGSSHLSREELSSTTHHKDLYVKDNVHMADGAIDSNEDLTFVPQASEDAVQDGAVSRKKRPIVVVDDDTEMREYMKMEFSSFFAVTACPDGEEAWKVISATIPDAVVTDLKMEGMDGAELCRRIRKNPETNHLPVIILTSETDDGAMQKCIDSGADSYLTKPVSMEIIISTLKQSISTRDTIRHKFVDSSNLKLDDVKMTSDEKNLVSRIVSSIKSNIDDPDFGVEQLSASVGMSRVHLNRKLKETMNISPSNLMKSIRLRQAAYLLVNNKVNISEVAYRVGFSTHSYFSSSFRDYFGMTPKEFVARFEKESDPEELKKFLQDY